MKNSKKGISLIVLIITIIVIVILATAILVSVISNNPISEANKARYESDRDNMQAVFTNTVASIMSKELGTVNVTSGQINTETTGVDEATGEVAYTVDNATVASNGSGTIKFDKGTNDATTYYTGKKLPIYAAGETKWYVDSEGVLSLEVAGVKYGSGSGSEGETLAAGLYDEEGNMTYSWDELMNLEAEVPVFEMNENTWEYEQNGTESVKIFTVSNGKLSSFSLFNEIDGASYIRPATDIEGKLVISDSISEFGYDCFAGAKFTEIILPSSITSLNNSEFVACLNLQSITIPNSVTRIGYQVFGNCSSLNSINFNGTMDEWNNIEKEELKGSEWNYHCPEFTVHCIDGDITIPANN